MTIKIGALVMAAGSSIRFGSDKRRYDTGDGALLQRTLRHVLSLGLPTAVALRHGDEEQTGDLLGAARHHVKPLYVHGAENGLGHSIAYCFKTPPSWDGALIFLGDMPDISADTGKTLLAHFQQDRIQVPAYLGRRGHPVLFPRRFFAALATLGGDTGARELLQREHTRVDTHEVNDPGILMDIDTPPTQHTPDNAR